MNLVQAQSYANKIANWLRPYCAIEVGSVANPMMAIAGSIRRQRPQCNDIDIVCIPKTSQEKDMLGAVLFNKNHLYDFIADYVKNKPGTRIVSGNTRGKMMIVDLPKCQLDLWFADEKTFATRLLCRTGSMDHNIWLASRAKRQGKKWNPYEGILYGGKWISPLGVEQCEGGQLIQFASEADIYASLDLPFIEPKDRELAFLNKNFGQ